MTAEEARKKSIENGPMLFESTFKRIISMLDNSIKTASKLGEFSVRQTVNLPNNAQSDVIGRLIKHYSKLGYKIEVFDGVYSQNICLSWEEGY